MWPSLKYREQWDLCLRAQLRKRTNFSDNVRQDQHARRILKRCNREDTGTDGARHPLTKRHCANEFGACSQDAGLDQGQGLRAHRRGI